MSGTVSTEDVRLTDDGGIFVDGEEVGYLGWSENVLVDISVDSSMRNQGIATVAVTKMVERMKAEGVEKVETTTVVSPAMTAVLEKVGFESRVVEEPLYEPEDLDADVSKDDIPTEEEVVWEYTI